MVYLFDFVNILLAPTVLIVLTTWLSGHYRQIIQRQHSRLYLTLIGGGTILHELSHAVFILLFGMRITGFQLWSGRTSGHLGHVQFIYRTNSPLHWVGLLFVGLAPLLMLSLFTYILMLAITPTFAPYPLDVTSLDNWLQWGSTWYQQIKSDPVTIGLIIIFAILLPAIVPSREDLVLASKGAIALVFILCCLVALAWCFNGYTYVRVLGYTFQKWTMAILFLNSLLSTGLVLIAWTLTKIITCISFKRLV